MATIEGVDPLAAQQPMKKRGSTPAAGQPFNQPQPTNGTAVNGAATTTNGKSGFTVNGGGSNGAGAAGLGPGAGAGVKLSAGDGLPLSMISSGISFGSPAADGEASGLLLLSPSSEDARAVVTVNAGEPGAEFAPDTAPSRQGYISKYQLLWI